MRLAVVLLRVRRPYVLRISDQQRMIRLTTERRWAHRSTAMPNSSTSPLPPRLFVLPAPEIIPCGAPAFSHHTVLKQAQLCPTPLSLTPTPPLSRSLLAPPAQNSCSTTP